ncbi:hypothetical protein Dimus_039520 [Dionaea muscipula]
MTSNIVENLNSCLRHARKLPICSVVEFVRDMLQRWFVERRDDAARSNSFLTEWATALVNKCTGDAECMQVKPIGNFNYQVMDGQRGYVVDLSLRSCTCRRFDLDLLPCAHAIAAVRYYHYHHRSWIYHLVRMILIFFLCRRRAKQSVASICADYYKVDTLMQMYAGRVCPVGDPDDWDCPERVREKLVNPPVIHIPAGRPKSRRIPSGAERRPRRQQRCSNCQDVGHNHVNCKGSTPLPVVMNEQD